MRFLLAAPLVGLIAVSLEAQTPRVATWRLTEELRIGAFDGPEALSQVGHLTLSPDGSEVYIALPQEHSIRVFSASSGAPLRTIGRHGEGPGEFRMLDRIGWAGDSLYATDFALQRFSLFSAAGDHHATQAAHPPLRPAARGGSYPVAVLPGGRVALRERLNSLTVADGTVTSTPLALLDPTDRSIRTLASRDLRETRAAIPIEGQRIHTTLVPQPLSNRSYLAIHPDGRSLVVVDQPAGRDTPGEYTVTRFGPDDERIRSGSYRYRPVPLPRAYVDSVYATEAQALGNWMEAGRAMETARKYVILPRTFPPVSGAVVARDDALWLRQPHTGGETARWLVLDVEGRLSASVTTPADLEILFADATYVWGVVQDEFDVPYVVRMRIVR